MAGQGLIMLDGRTKPSATVLVKSLIESGQL
jgi:hypothetical protein